MIRKNESGQSAEGDEARAGGEEMSECSRQALWGERRRRVPKGQLRNLGDPAGSAPLMPKPADEFCLDLCVFLDYSPRRGGFHDLFS